MSKPIVWSYGGGTQSAAIGVLVAQGKLPKPDVVIMADTGDEASETWTYTIDVMFPLLRSAGIDAFHIVSPAWSTVGEYALNGDLLMPAYTEHGKLPTFCSKEWKTRPVHRYLKKQLDIHECIMWIGMSIDEIERLKPADVKWIEHHWPLCGMPRSASYGVQMRRADCVQLIEHAGLPPAPKSSCWKCPHRRNPQWQHLKMFYPGDFAKAVEKDRAVRAHDIARGGSGVWLHASHKPLDEIDFRHEEDQPSLFGCDSGFCWT